MIKQITDNIFLVVTREGFGTGNILLIEDEIRCLIDTGARGALPDVRPEFIDMVINSHHHIDHVSGNEKCMRAEFFIHELEMNAVNSVAKMTATEGWDELMGNENIGKRDHLKKGTLEVDYGKLRFDGTVHDGETISCGRTSFNVIHTPGHTPGHCVFYFPETDFVFLADLCLTKFGPWYGDSDSDIDDILSSINRVMAMNCSMAATSHRRDIVTGKVEVNRELSQLRDRVLSREEKIYSFLKKAPADFETVVREKIIYPVHPMGFLLFWEKCMVRIHLLHMKTKGTVASDENGIYHAL